MVPNISPNGTSFRGAGAYHLHDKPTATEVRPRTALRVAFTVTRNLANEDARAALDEMWRTAEDATHLKAASGSSHRGRKNDAPVKTISLAWAPGQTPTPKLMTEAADDFLRAMGWHQHQAIYVGHSDTAHPHLHIILNRIHPDTGRTLNDWQDRRRAQQWALGYERQQGSILCEGRALREEGRRASPASALPHAEAKLLQPHSQPVRMAVSTTLRREFRPTWAQHFRTRSRLRGELRICDAAARRTAVSLAREGDFPRAHAALDRFQTRRAKAFRLLAGLSSAIRAAQFDKLRSLVSATLPTAANDNARRSVSIAAPVRNQSRVRFSVLLSAPNPPPANPLRQLTAMLRCERQQLRAAHFAARAMLRLRGRTGRSASALAHSEIATAFASRWAAIEQMPAALRAAAIAALRTEQAMALRARLAYHLSRLLGEQRMLRQRLSSLQLTERRTLMHRHRQSRAVAVATIKALRPERAPPLPASGAAFHVAP